jgi:hypothetical protein
MTADVLVPRRDRGENHVKPVGVQVSHMGGFDSDTDNSNSGSCTRVRWSTCDSRSCAIESEKPTRKRRFRASAAS